MHKVHKRPLPPQTAMVQQMLMEASGSVCIFLSEKKDRELRKKQFYFGCQCDVGAEWMCYENQVNSIGKHLATRKHFDSVLASMTTEVIASQASLLVSSLEEALEGDPTLSKWPDWNRFTKGDLEDIRSAVGTAAAYFRAVSFAAVGWAAKRGTQENKVNRKRSRSLSKGPADSEGSGSIASAQTTTRTPPSAAPQPSSSGTAATAAPQPSSSGSATTAPPQPSPFPPMPQASPFGPASPTRPPGPTFSFQLPPQGPQLTSAPRTIQDMAAMYNRAMAAARNTAVADSNNTKKV